MADAYKHQRHFQVLDGDENKITFSSTDDANTKIGFKSVWDTGSPTKSYQLQDSNQTLVVTYEFASESDQTSFKTAVDNTWSTGLPWKWEDRDFIDHGLDLKIKDGKTGAGTALNISTAGGSESYTTVDGSTVVTGRSARIQAAREQATGVKGSTRQDAAEAYWKLEPIHIKTVWFKGDGTTVDSEADISSPRLNFKTE